MKKWVFITAAVMFAAGLALGGAYVALAQGRTPPTPPFGGSFGPGMMRGWGYSQGFSGTVPMGPGMMRGWSNGQGYTGTVPFGPGRMRGWNFGQGYTGTVPMGPGMMRGWSFGQGYTGTVPFGPGMMGYLRDEMMGPGGVHEQVWTAVAQRLGLTYGQLQNELRTKTLAQLAQEKGVSLETLQSVAQDAWEAAINTLVEQGKLTREQADWMIQHMDQAGFPMMGLGFGQGPCNGGTWGPQGLPLRGPGMMGRTW